MPLDAPFQLGPFVVDPQDRIEPGEAGCAPEFPLSWRGCSVHAQLAAGDAGSGGLSFSTVVGRVPSTAGGDAAVNGARRARMFDAVRGLESAVEASWRVHLLADHRVAVGATRNLTLPASVVDLLTQVTCFLPELAPHLDMLDEIDRPDGAPESGWTGTRNTWPG